MKFEIIYNGHAVNARRALLKMGLVKSLEELAYMSDLDVEKAINNSGYLIFQSGDSWILVPKELEDKLIWIDR